MNNATGLTTYQLQERGLGLVLVKTMWSRAHDKDDC